MALQSSEPDTTRPSAITASDITLIRVAGERPALAARHIPDPQRPVAEPDTTRPSASTASEVTRAVWPVSARLSPLATSQTRSVWSEEPETTRPSASTASDVTPM